MPSRCPAPVADRLQQAQLNAQRREALSGKVGQLEQQIDKTANEIARAMLCCQVFGNDVAITVGGASGNFELNVYKPMIAHNFLQSARLLADGMRSFDHHCAQGIAPNRDRIGELMERSLMLVTALAPHIGYDKAAQIAKKAQHEGCTLQQAALALGYVTEQQFAQWIDPLAMTRPGVVNSHRSTQLRASSITTRNRMQKITFDLARRIRRTQPAAQAGRPVRQRRRRQEPGRHRRVSVDGKKELRKTAKIRAGQTVQRGRRADQRQCLRTAGRLLAWQ